MPAWVFQRLLISNTMREWPPGGPSSFRRRIFLFRSLRNGLSAHVQINACVVSMMEHHYVKDACHQHRDGKGWISTVTVSQGAAAFHYPDGYCNGLALQCVGTAIRCQQRSRRSAGAEQRAIRQKAVLNSLFHLSAFDPPALSLAVGRHLHEQRECPPSKGRHGCTVLHSLLAVVA